MLKIIISFIASGTKVAKAAVANQHNLKIPILVLCQILSQNSERRRNMSSWRYTTAIVLGLICFYIPQVVASEEQTIPLNGVEKEITGRVHFYGNRYILKDCVGKECFVILENGALETLLAETGHTDICRVEGIIYHFNQTRYFLIKKYQKTGNSQTTDVTCPETQDTQQTTDNASDQKTQSSKQSNQKKTGKKVSSKKSAKGKKSTEKKTKNNQKQSQKAKDKGKKSTDHKNAKKPKKSNSKKISQDSKAKDDDHK